jgi:hypothetical protein
MPTDDTPNSPRPDDESLADAFARRLAEVEHDNQIGQAHARAVSEVGTARSWDLASVVRRAMRETVHLGEFERELATRFPPAARRLRLLGDVAVLCLAEVIAAAGREMVGHTGEAAR